MAKGGTNSSTALNNNSVMVSAAGAIVELGAATDGQLVVGSTGSAPVLTALTGTANQVVVTNGAGSITLSLPQSINTAANVAFNQVTAALVGNASTATSLQLGAANEIPYQSGAGATAYMAAANDSLVLTGATGIPSLSQTLPSQIVVGGATANDPTTSGTNVLNTVLTNLYNYTNSAIQGLSWKANVNAAATNNIDITSAPASVDSIPLSAGDRVLLTAQTDPIENGIWIFAAVGSPFTRSADMNTGSTANGASVIVDSGAGANSGTIWVCTSPDGSAVVGTDNLTFSELPNGVYQAGTGLSLTTNTFDLIPATSSSLGGVIAGQAGSNITNTAGTLSVATATSSNLGVVQPDGSIITVASGAITVATSTASQLGVVSPDDATIKASAGVLSVQPATVSQLGGVIVGSNLSVTAGTISVPTSTASVLGVVSPDNVTIKATAGVLNVVTATASVLGVVSPDNATIVATAGVLSVQPATSSQLGAVIAGQAGSNISNSGGTLSVATATTGTLGVASFNSTNFSVTLGAVNTVQNIDTTATPNFASTSLSANTNQIVLGTTNTTTITMAGLSASRVVTFPDASSNTVVPAIGATSNEFVTYIDAGGVQHTAQPTMNNVAVVLATTATSATMSLSTNKLVVTGNGLTITLPLVANAVTGQEYTIQLVVTPNASASCTVEANSGDSTPMIDGSPSWLIANNYNSITVYTPDNAQWVTA